jgi:uncharacterized protein
LSVTRILSRSSQRHTHIGEAEVHGVLDTSGTLASGTSIACVLAPSTVRVKYMNAVTHPARRSTLTLTWIAFGLLIVGGVNWGLIGLFGFDLVAAIFGSMSPLSRVVYVLVGIAAVYCAIAIPALAKRAVTPI